MQKMTYRNRLVRTTAIALGLAATGGTAPAQELSETMLLGKVVLGYSQDGTPITAGENTTGLDRDDLREQGGTTSIDNILRQQTSVFTQENPANPGVAVNIRGFEGSGRVATSVDGVPQTYRFTGHAAQGYTYVDENLLAGIDITRGAVTTAGGTGIAGAVNFRTLSAEDVVDGKGFGGIVRLNYGDNGNDFSPMLGVGYLDDRFDMFVAVSGRGSDDYDDANGNAVAYSGKDTRSGLLKLGYRLDDRQKLSFSAMRYDSEFSANSYEQELTSDTYTLGYDFDAGDGLINLDVDLYYARIDSEYGDYVGTSSFGGGSVGRQMTTRTAGGDVTNISEVSFGAWDVTTINGAEISQDRLSGSNAGVNPADGTSTRAALFSENILTYGDLEITAGLRGSFYELEGDTDSGPLDQSDQSLDPKLTVAYWVTPWLQPYVTWSRTMRAPTLQETLLGGTHPGAGTAGMIANPDLKPETSNGFDIGFNIQKSGLFSADDNLSGRVNYYRMDVEDYVIASFGFTNAYGNTGTAFINAPGTSETSGLEVELDYENDGLLAGLSFTANDSDMPSQIAGLGTGQYLPDQTVSIRLTGKFLQDKLRLGGQYNYVSGGLYSEPYATEAVQRDDDYDLVDVFAVYEVSDNVTIHAKIANLFNQDYTPWLATDDKGPGRSLYFGAEIIF
ncbi:TonB-dependent hemin, ferrichrome receptor (plasmid) [Rhodovulum sp. P5]|uniref:TonB-dependent receptor domain-containing protein n=1 Tax=Rhodovulum sp. P5 TaxID=1564506 RepID=UPI0009C3CCBB|nr:TonB-dependent receptor [Rhodovulum sp. P5]ARE42422.1 TonB-dependent hemin, ferrichrome receptor [Rhodovulum sp. P5]